MSKLLQATCVSLFSMVALTLVGTTAMAQPYAYVANLQGNNISVVDTRTNAVVKSVSARISPTALATTKDGALLVAALQASNAIAIYRTSDMAQLATVAVGARPVQVGITANDQYAFVVNQGSNSVSVVDLNSHAVVQNIGVATYPNGLEFTPDGTKVIIGSEYGKSVQVIDVASRSVIRSIPTGAGPVSMAVAPNGWKLYVANQYSGSVTVHDLNSGALLDTITGFAMPKSLAMNSKGTRILVANMNGAAGSIVDTSSDNVVGKFSAGSLPTGAAISADGVRGYITNANDYTMTVADMGTGSVVATISMVGIYPVAVLYPGSSTVSSPTTSPDPTPTCSYSLTPTSVSIGVAGGAANVTVNTQSGCPWGVSEGSSWISLTSSAAGTGSGSVSIAVAPNTGGARSGSVTVAGKTFTVNQEAMPVVSVFPGIRVNSGGPIYIDSQGRTWAADENGPRATTTAAVANTSDSPLYQKERFSTGAVRYSFAVPNGTYNVKLKFAEIYLDATEVGRRVMTVKINDQVVVSGLDILAETGGPFRAHDRVYPVNVTNGTIAIEITATAGTPKVNAIEITQ